MTRGSDPCGRLQNRSWGKGQWCCPCSDDWLRAQYACVVPSGGAVSAGSGPASQEVEGPLAPVGYRGSQMRLIESYDVQCPSDESGSPVGKPCFVSFRVTHTGRGRVMGVFRGVEGKVTRRRCGAARGDGGPDACQEVGNGGIGDWHECRPGECAPPQAQLFWLQLEQRQQEWGTEPCSPLDHVIFAGIQVRIAEYSLKGWRHAAKAWTNWITSLGLPLVWSDFEDLVHDSIGGPQVVFRHLQEVITWGRNQQECGAYHIASGWVSGLNAISNDWRFAVREYGVWGEASVIVGPSHISGSYTLHMVDPFWFEEQDEQEFGHLHLCGLAKDYMMLGNLNRTLHAHNRCGCSGGRG